MNNKLYALVGSAVMLASCEKQGEQAKPTEAASEKIAAVAGTKTTTTATTLSGLNPSHQVLTKYLDMHGQSISLTDKSEMWDSVMSLAKGLESVLAENERSYPKGLSLVDMIEKTKINSATKIGSSILKVDGGYLNKTFIDLGGERSGIFSIFDGKGDTWTVAEFAPSGSDYVSEADIKVENLLETFDYLTKGVDPNVVGKIRGEFEKAIGENPQMAEVAKGIHLRVSSVMKIVEGETITLPQGISFPKVELAYRVKGGNALIAQFIPIIESESIKEEKNGLTYYSPKEEIPQEALDAGLTYKPVFVVDKVNGELWISSNGSFFEDCLSQNPKLKDDSDFKKIIGSLDTSGNMLEYVSHDIIKKFHTLYEDYLRPFLKSEAKQNETGVELAMVNHGLSLLENRLFPALLKAKEGFASTVSLNDDGILIAAKSPIPFEMTRSVAPVFVVAGLASISSPVIIRQFAKARATTAINNGKDIYAGIRNYAFKNSGEIPAAEGYKNANAYFKEFLKSGCITDEKSFFVKGVPGAIEPNKDGNLSAGENVFGVIPGTSITNDSANKPILIAPFVDGELDATVFGNQIMVITVDGAARVYPTDGSGEVYDSSGKLIYKDGTVYYDGSEGRMSAKVLKPE